MRGQPSAQHVRVSVEIEQDEDGFPGVAVERLWCRRMGPHSQVDNIPFFIKGLAWGDVISARLDSGELWAHELIAESGHATIWILVRDESPVDEVRAILSRLGCSSEASHLPRYILVDVPATVDRELVRAALQDGEVGGRWEYAEGVALNRR
jgi:hypothetical protein